MSKERYSLEGEIQRSFLSKDIKSGELNNLSMEDVRNLLPEDQDECLKLLNYEDGAGSVLRSSVISSNSDLLDKFIKLGANLRPKELGYILLNDVISNIATRRALFNIAIAHIYDRLSQVSSLEAPLFEHIYKIESFLKIAKQKELRNELVDNGFPEEFRARIAPVLHKAGITYEDFLAKLISFEENQDEVLVISKEGKAEWQKLLSELALHQEELPTRAEGKRDDGLTKQREYKGDVKEEELTARTTRLSDELDPLLPDQQVSSSFRDNSDSKSWVSSILGEDLTRQMGEFFGGKSKID